MATANKSKPTQTKTTQSKNSVFIYSTSSCPYCQMAKDYLKEHNITYNEYDVGKDKTKAEEMIEKSGQMGVPVIDINGEIIIGFDREKIKKALHITD